MNNWYAYNVLVNDRHRSRQRTANHSAAARTRRATAGRTPLATLVREWFGGARPASVTAQPPAAVPRIEAARVDLSAPEAAPVATGDLDGRRASRSDGSAASDLDRVA